MAALLTCGGREAGPVRLGVFIGAGGEGGGGGGGERQEEGEGGEEGGHGGAGLRREGWGLLYTGAHYLMRVMQASGATVSRIPAR